MRTMRLTPPVVRVASLKSGMKGGNVRFSAVRIASSRLVGLALLLAAPVPRVWAWTFDSYVVNIALSPGGVLVAERGSVLLLDTEARSRQVRWRYKPHGYVDAMQSLPNGDLVAAGTFARRPQRRGLYVTRVAARNGRGLWRWTATPPGQGQETIPSAVAVDGAGDVLVAPQSSDSNAARYDSEFTVIKLAGDSGAERWTATIADLIEANALTADSDGDVVATALKSPLGAATVVKLAGATGQVVWRADLPASWSEVAAVAGPGGSVVVRFVVGFPNIDQQRAGVAKLSAADGTMVWIDIPSPGMPGFATEFAAIAARDSDVYAVGRANKNETTSAFTVSRFDGGTGAPRWTYTAGGGAGEAYEMGFNANGQVIAAGYVANGANCEDGLVVSLDPTSGTVAWSKTFDGTFVARDCSFCFSEFCPPVDNDFVNAVAIDPDGPIVVDVQVLNRLRDRAREQWLVERIAPARSELLSGNGDSECHARTPSVGAGGTAAARRMAQLAAVTCAR
jgi:hypothetical protein